MMDTDTLNRRQYLHRKLAGYIEAIEAHPTDEDADDPLGALSLRERRVVEIELEVFGPTTVLRFWPETGKGEILSTDGPEDSVSYDMESWSMTDEQYETLASFYGIDE